MLKLLDLRGDRTDPAERLPRPPADRQAAVAAAVREVLDAVRSDGDAALARYTKAFDGWDGTDFVVPASTAKAALDALSEPLRGALERMVEQVRWFAQRSRPADWLEERDGVRLGVAHRPLRRVGVYVPGGRAPLVSTVVMTVVPARVAGVGEVVLCTPPGPQGRVDPAILAAAALAGADRIVRVGGAQAVAAMAYGTESVPRCDKVVGPGNVYVNEAKQQVAAGGRVGIDLPAGVTEVAVIADDTADPRVVAADLVGQAEHDPLVTALLITPSAALIAAVESALAEQVPATRHRERVRTALEGQGAAVLVDDLDHAVEVADAFGAEHLEVITAEAASVAGRVRAAGVVFVGPHSPVSVGDYGVGPNHTLPTGGAAHFTGGLRTDDFMVPVNWVELTEPALAAAAPLVAALAAAEDLPAHAAAVALRLERRP